jgi:hypothetical protein
MATRDRSAAGADPALHRRIMRHRRAFLAYERYAPLGDPIDPRFSAAMLPRLDRWQRREARRRRDLLAHPVRSLADMRAKAGYLLAYPDSDFLIDGPGELALFLRAMAAGKKPAPISRPGNQYE